jgi:N utilization substance protein A
VRGNRIKNIVDELAGERIDIVRWDDNLEVLIPNALQPAEVEQVILCKMLGRGIVLVREDQLSLAIGRRGQNVRLASKLSGWDIEIMTQEELAQAIERAVSGFSSLQGVEVELAERLVEEGFLSYDDLSIIEPDALMAMGNLDEETTNLIIEQAEERAEQAEAAAAEARRQKREQERLAEMAAEAGMKLAPEGEEAEAEPLSEAGELTQPPGGDEEEGAAQFASGEDETSPADAGEETSADNDGSAELADAEEEAAHERSETAT